METLHRSNVISVKYGTETITSLGAKILPNDYKEPTSLSAFKLKIKNSETDKCPCRTYMQNIYSASSFYLTGHCYVRSMFVKHHFRCSSCLLVCCSCFFVFFLLLLLLFILLLLLLILLFF